MFTPLVIIRLFVFVFIFASSLRPLPVMLVMFAEVWHNNINQNKYMTPLVFSNDIY